MKKIIAIISAIVFNSSASSTLAQIIPDRSLPNNSEVINNQNQILIEGGTIKGDNLFHSFESFSILNNLEVIFNNPSVANIFTRITGNSISIIDGILGVNGNANLFFLNPQGIIFGSNAQLNLNGAFVATSANSISFEDSFVFSASDLTNSSVLTVSVPIGLNFDSSSGSIEVNNNGHNLTFLNTSLPNIIAPFDNKLTEKGLEISNGTLALIGGEIVFNGGIINNRTVNNIEIIAVDSGSINFNLSGAVLDFIFKDNLFFKDIHLNSQSLISIFGNNQGYINLRGNNLNILQSSIIIIQNQSLIDEKETSININVNNLLIDEGIDRTDISSGIVSETIGLDKGANIQI